MNRKILLVEDDESLAKALGMRLDSFGYRTIFAENVATAMSCIVHRKPDISLIDINLPDGNGFSIASQIVKNPNAMQIPVIFISASSSRDYIERARGFTPIPLLQKPFTGNQLMRTLELSQYAEKHE